VRPRAITVEIEPDDPRTDDPHAARSFAVQLRRGPRAVIVAADLGRFSAAALAEDLRELLGPARRRTGGTTE